MVDLLRCELHLLLDLFLTSFGYIDQPNTDQKCFIHLLHDLGVQRAYFLFQPLFVNGAHLFYQDHRVF